MATTERLPDGAAAGRWWRPSSDGRIVCELCPRQCHLKPGDRGFCFVRSNRDGAMVLETYGKSTGFCIDPIEKKPLNQFLPGTPILSFGTAGCNLGCKFCQNWDISKSREVERLSAVAEPDAIADAALQSGCQSVAFTYNDPVIWAEYAIDVARACRRVGLKTVAVTAGYISPDARSEFFAEMDAANVDLKAFTEEFYFKVTSSHLEPVLDTLRFLRHETDVWFELTNLVIPGENDRPDEFHAMVEWILKHLGPDIPLHFSAFHPDYRMRDRPHTPVETLIAAYDIATQAGLHYVYLGNVHDAERQATRCPNCRRVVIERNWYELGAYHLRGNRCAFCDTSIAGRFSQQPGTWGRRRLPVVIPSSSSPFRANSSVPPSPSATRSQPAIQQEPSMQGPATASPAAMSAEMPLSPVELSEIQRFAAGEVIRNVLKVTRYINRPMDGSLANRGTFGVFVTLKRQGMLRSCCGSLGEQLPLAEATAFAAKRTALEDPRFPPLSPGELPYVSIDVSVLSRPVRLTCPPEDRVNQIRIGEHGLRIMGDGKAGLLLPSVAPEQGWNAEQFLAGVCRKAGLPATAWRSSQTVLEIFSGQIVHGDVPDLSGIPLTAPSLLQHAEVVRLTEHARQNIAAVVRGATPAYYALDVPDGTVGGIVLELRDPVLNQAASVFQLSLRPGLPLQSTLYQLCEQAGRWIGRQSARAWELSLLILDDPALHGFVSACDLRGIDPSERALSVVDGQQSAVAFDRGASSEELLRRCLEKEKVNPDRTQVFSWRAATAASAVCVGNSPAAARGGPERPPAVAGSFYPAEDQERDAMVDAFIAGSPKQPRIAAVAAMTPHAGLRYSGQIATDVWNRIEIPASVLIIGPKHTPHGVRWAVAPHQTWRLSATTSLQNDLGLSRAIASQVGGMQLDAAAHAGEHGIEVQLPILSRIAPQTRVAAIAMGSATWDELVTAASQLATVLRQLPKMPLLVISSDMNHFADDAETRRRDHVAMAALERNDPRGLLQVCQEEQISMCGQIPAALVLLTLEKLGLHDARLSWTGYGTSGDVTQDRSRVVGYAGCIWS